MPVPYIDPEKLDRMRQQLSGASYTIKALQSRYRLSERTVYRWLRRLEHDGHDLISRRAAGKVVYTIL